MGDGLLLNIGLFLIGLLVFVLLVLIILCTDVCAPSATAAYSIDMVNMVGHEPLLRENLEDTVLSDGEAEWQCIVCLHLNRPSVDACHLCGASQEASTLTTTTLLSDTAILGNTVLGATFLSNFGGSIGGGPFDGSQSSTTIMQPLDLSMGTRQRALRYRRLNRMQLTQRQRGAQRRRLWQRVQLPSGAFIWVRTALPVFKTKDTLVARLRLRRSRPMHSNELTETLAEQLHRKNAATLGFFSELDDHGRVAFKPTTDAVAVPIEDAAMGDHDLDLEGLMSLPFREKKKWFLKQVAALAVHFTQGVLKLRVRRSHVLQDSLPVLAGALTDVQLRQHLNIAFDGEPALDAGGVLREWFGLVTQALFSAELGVFVPTSGESSSYWLNPRSAQQLGPDHLRYFRFAGRLLGKAVLEGLVLDAHVALPLLKHVLGVPITFSDLEFLDDELFKSCSWIRDNDNVDALCVTFSVAGPGGDDDIVDLKPGGRDIDVTDENKLEYLALVLRYRMLDAVAEQLSALLSGLYDVIPKALLAVFDYQELDFFLCGLPTINVDDWETHSRVRHLTKPGDADYLVARQRELEVAQWFWAVVRNFSDEERARLLQFATGSSRVPVEGFKALTSASGYVHPFTLQLVPRGTPPLGLCPRAHTCFNRIDLPLYADKEELETYLTLVIQMEITGFGFE
ncbi:hypothetical protein PINS_up002778 [Pythium insidiosum]|nr:hypothetical protein PINS_up002778 [Pythium insidiosum]